MSASTEFSLGDIVHLAGLGDFVIDDEGLLPVDPSGTEQPISALEGATKVGSIREAEKTAAPVTEYDEGGRENPTLWAHLRDDHDLWDQVPYWADALTEAHYRSHHAPETETEERSIFMLAWPPNHTHPRRLQKPKSWSYPPKTAANVHVNMIEDASGDLVDIEYYHHYCAQQVGMAENTGWPAPESQDSPVYCAHCSERIEEIPLTEEGQGMLGSIQEEAERYARVSVENEQRKQSERLRDPENLPLDCHRCGEAIGDESYRWVVVGGTPDYRESVPMHERCHQKMMTPLDKSARSGPRHKVQMRSLVDPKKGWDLSCSCGWTDHAKNLDTAQAAGDKHKSNADSKKSSSAECPTCGGPKSKNLVRCWKCHEKDVGPVDPKDKAFVRGSSFQKGAPFAGYSSWEDCISKNQDKDDPKAYCGSIKHKVEGKKGATEVLGICASCLGTKECQSCYGQGGFVNLASEEAEMKLCSSCQGTTVCASCQGE